MPMKKQKPTYTKQVHIKMTEETHKKLRIRAAESDMSLQDFTLNAIIYALKRKKRAKECAQ